MKYQTTPAFDRDFKKLREHQELFKAKAFPLFHDAAVRAAAGEPDPWPNSFRVKTVQGADGIWEMTWSKDNPDGRATWQWVRIDGELGIRWRRVGTHKVLEKP